MVTCKDGEAWATDAVRTAGAAARLELIPERTSLSADGKDLCFVTLRVADENSLTVLIANNNISFELSVPAEIIATDNDYPTSFVPFTSHERETFNGLALAIIRAKAGESGKIKITAKSPGLKDDCGGDQIN